MDEQICQRCGAQNRADAPYCWRCYASFGGRSSPSETVATGRIGAATSASGTGNGSVTAAPRPPVAPVCSRSDRTRWVWVLLFVVGFAGGWWVINQLFFQGFPFPDQVAGQPRVESREAEEATEALSALGGLLDVKMEFAFYGPEVQPAYVMFAFELPERLSPLDVQATSTGSIPFRCRTDVQGSGCIWEVEGMVVGLGGSGTPEELEPAARRVRAELQS